MKKNGRSDFKHFLAMNARMKFDFVITFFDRVKNSFPFFPGGSKYIHKSFYDTSELHSIEEEIMIRMQALRNEIKKLIKFGQKKEKAIELIKY
ncbi:MAG: hypothetical protein ACUVUG_08380 [Candidatus Aminicenantia bacterium]